MSEAGSGYPVREAQGAAGPLPRASVLPGPAYVSAVALARLLKCLVCHDYVLPPFVQCPNGHLMCSACRQKNTRCVACQSPIGSIRNLAMELVVSMALFPCKYSLEGCPALLSYSDLPEHDEDCQFTPCQCPCLGGWCMWRGPLVNVMTHLGHMHEGIGRHEEESIVFQATGINRPGTVDWAMIQTCFGHHFFVALEKEEKPDGRQQFSGRVQLIGSRRQADKFTYRLELHAHARRLAWEATPRSICEGVEGATMSIDCLVFDGSTAQRFADHADLNINVTIWRF